MRIKNLGFLIGAVKDDNYLLPAQFTLLVILNKVTIMISFVILSYNREDIVINSINKSLELGHKYFRDGFEVIVVDNNSSDKSKSLYESITDEKVEFILNKSNLGVAGGRNCGLKKASGDWVFILDDDSILEESAVTEFKENKDDNIGIYALNVKDMNTGDFFSEGLVDNRLISNFHGAGHIINKKLINIIGLLDEDCTFGGEELDYSIRCQKVGYKLIMLESAHVFHYCIKRSGTVNYERHLKWVFNYTRVIFKHLPIAYGMLFSLRYLIPHLFIAMKTRSPKLFFQMLWCYIEGFRKGVPIGGKLEKKLLKKYLNKKMRPQFGNVPLLTKLKNHFQ